MEKEIPLTGGRVTQGVVKVADTVRRPLCENSPTAHRAMKILQDKNIHLAPKLLGIDKKGREITEFIDGFCPPDLDCFSEEQLVAAAKLIAALHRALKLDNETVICHGDLSPCNFMFVEDVPSFVIDWDAAHEGSGITDLAYAIWLWLDIGNEELPPTETTSRIHLMADAYGLNKEGYAILPGEIVKEMERVGKSVFENKAQQSATRSWALDCRDFFIQNIKSLLLAPV